jgi:hypothetical protein
MDCIFLLLFFRIRSLLFLFCYQLDGRRLATGDFLASDACKIACLREAFSLWMAMNNGNEAEYLVTAI